MDQSTYDSLDRITKEYILIEILVDDATFPEDDDHILDASYLKFHDLSDSVQNAILSGAYDRFATATEFEHDPEDEPEWGEDWKEDNGEAYQFNDYDYIEDDDDESFDPDEYDYDEESYTGEGKSRNLCWRCEEGEHDYCLFDPEGSGNMCDCNVCGNTYKPNEYQLMQKMFGSDGGHEISDFQYRESYASEDSYPSPMIRKGQQYTKKSHHDYKDVGDDTFIVCDICGWISGKLRPSTSDDYDDTIHSRLEDHVASVHGLVQSNWAESYVKKAKYTSNEGMSLADWAKFQDEHGWYRVGVSHPTPEIEDIARAMGGNYYGISPEGYGIQEWSFHNYSDAENFAQYVEGKSKTFDYGSDYEQYGLKSRYQPEEQHYVEGPHDVSPYVFNGDKLTNIGSGAIGGHPLRNNPFGESYASENIKDIMKKYGIRGSVRKNRSGSHWTHVITPEALGGIDIESFVNDDAFIDARYFRQDGTFGVVYDGESYASESDIVDGIIRAENGEMSDEELIEFVKEHKNTLMQLQGSWQRTVQSVLNYIGESYASEYKVGDYVRMTDDAIDNYGEQYRDKEFRISHVAKSVDDHMGYDESIGGNLYDFDELNFSLYDYELE